MKTPLFLSAFALVALTLQTGTALAAPGQKSAAKPPPADTAEARPAKPALTKGMTAETVIGLIGRPLQIKPMDAPEGKAEVWTYRRVAKKWTTQTAATTEEVPAFIGIGMGAAGDGMGSVTTPIYRLEHITVYQVTRLLMFEDQLVNAKQWLEQERSFD
jgi:hypothetical protein